MSELTDPALSASILADGHWSRFTVVDETGSTNADLLADATAPAGAVLVARHQTAGRGRLDRQWQAVSGGALTFSVLLQPAVPGSRWGWLPLLAGLAVQQALADRGIDSRLKWPNDLLVGEGKAGGVLVQRADRDGAPIAVVGIGLNLTVAPEGVEGAAVLGEPDAGGLLAAVLHQLGAILVRWEATGGDAVSAGLSEEYRRVCASLGRRVVAHRPGAAPLTGTAYAIDEIGRIVLRRDAEDLAAAATDDRDCAAREVAVGAGDVIHLR